jgi:GT2 family glycosyltransferase
MMIYDDESNIIRVRGLDASTQLIALRNNPVGLSVIVLNKDKPSLLSQIQRGFRIAAAQSSVPMELLIGDTGSQNPETLDLYEASELDENIVYLENYHFSKNNNYLAGISKYSTLLFLNNDVLIEHLPEVLYSAWLIHSKLDINSIVSAKLVYPDLRLQHNGVDFFREGPFKNLPFHTDHGLPNSAYAERARLKKVTAVTGAFLTISVQTFARAGGFDETYFSECQDIALCLEVNKLGGKCHVFDPGNLVHLENATRPKGEENWNDRARFLRKYSRYVEIFT